MEFKLSQLKKNKTGKSVNIPVETLDRVIYLLSKVECTCIWSDYDNQYIKINDIPESLVNELKVIRGLNETLHNYE